MEDALETPVQEPAADWPHDPCVGFPRAEGPPVVAAGIVDTCDLAHFTIALAGSGSGTFTCSGDAEVPRIGP